MNFRAIQTQLLKEGFPLSLTTLVVQIQTIHLTLDMDTQDYIEQGRFEKRIIEKVNSVFWEEDPEVIEQAINIWKVLHDWELGETLGGLGGCETKTILELLAEAKLKK